MIRIFELGILLLLVVSAVARANCTVSVTTVAFGTYNSVSSTATDTTGTLTVTADASSCGAYTIAFGRSGTSYNPRVFTSGPTTNFAFNLYLDAARTTIWGDGTAGTQAVTGTALGANATRTHTIYGRIPASQAVTPGAYSASIVASSSTTSGTITPTSLTFIATASAATCSISANPLAFGTYAGLQTDATSTLSVNCSNTIPYRIGLSAGNGNGATVTTRRMQGSDAAGLHYALFRDSGRTQNWGITVGSNTVAGTGSGATQVITVSGRIAAGQRIAPGNYADTIVATVTF